VSRTALALRLACGLGVAFATSGCDRVFGLIGNDEPPIDAPPVDDVLPPILDIGDGSAVGFCATQSPAVFCADFDAAPYPGGFAASSNLSGTGMETMQLYRSAPSAADLSVTATGVSATDDGITLSTLIDFSAGSTPSVYALSVFIEPGATDATFVSLSNGEEVISLRLSGVLTDTSENGAGGTVISIPRGEWVDLELHRDSGDDMMTIVVNGSSSASIGLAPHTAETQSAMTVGLWEAKSDNPFGETTHIYIDNVVIR
jgi:hypothetical protein